MPADEPTSEPAFVIVAQVLAQGAATLDAVPIDRGTFVVGVVETIKSPAQIGDLSGFEITVQQETPSVEPGQTYVFEADGWLLGDGIAVVARSAEPAGPGAAPTLERTTMDPLEPIRQRVRESELIVTGRVTRLNEVRRARQPITEHDPMWCEAVIEVDTVEKSLTGDQPKRVTVRYAASEDVMWASSPTFAIGDAGIFMLGNADAPEAERALSQARADQYTLVRPEDAVSLEHLDDVRAIVEGN